MVFPFVYSHDTPKYGGRDKEQFFNNVVIPRIISWVSNCYISTLPDIGRYIASQLLVLLRLVHTHTHPSFT